TATGRLFPELLLELGRRFRHPNVEHPAPAARERAEFRRRRTGQQPLRPGHVLGGPGAAKLRALERDGLADIGAEFLGPSADVGERRVLAVAEALLGVE